MRHGFYVPHPKRMDYSSFFSPDIPIEIHVKAQSVEGIVYLAKKYYKMNSSTHAQYDSETNSPRLMDTYTGSRMNDYYGARRYFLWLTEDEVVFLESNSTAKHVLERWED